MTRFTGSLAALVVSLIDVNGIYAQAPATCESSADSIHAVAALAQDIRQRKNPLQDLSFLTDVIGPRLTGSTQLLRAHD